MGIPQRVVKPKSHYGKRVIENKEPKTVENTKSTLFLNGLNTSEVARRCLKDLYVLKKQFGQLMQKKNPIQPFEDISPLERLAEKHDSSLFAFINHNKKRPNNLILGRMYDYHLLDMVEFGISDFKSISDFPGAKISVGTKPCLVFCGPEFDENDDTKRIKSLFLDFFRGIEASSIRRHGFEHVLQFTYFQGQIYFRSYKILLMKSGVRIPRIELEEIGPSFSLHTGRMKLASLDLFKTACKQPKTLKPKKKKNISSDIFGTKLGRVHMKRQDLSRLQTRKLKGLRKDNNAPREKRMEID